MTNEEIRIKIAQAKGWKFGKSEFSDVWWAHHNSLGSLGDTLIAAIEKEADAIGEKTNWSESIADAWELFEEMPTEKALKQYDAESVSWACFCDGEYTHDIAERGDTAPLAICLAWLAWDAARKEAENG